MLLKIKFMLKHTILLFLLVSFDCVFGDAFKRMGLSQELKVADQSQNDDGQPESITSIVVEEQAAGQKDFCRYVRDKIFNPNFLNYEELVDSLNFEQNELFFANCAPLIGAYNLYSQQIIAGIRACFMQVNDSGGVHGKFLRLLAVNDYNRPELAYKIIRRLFRRYGFNVFLGNFGSSQLLPVMPLIKDEKILALFPCANNRSFLTPYLRNIINGCNNKELQIDKILEFSVHKLRARKIAIFYSKDEVGTFLSDYTTMWLKRMHVNPAIAIGYNPKNILINSIADQLIKECPDLVICLGDYIPNARLITRFLKNNLHHTIFVGTDEMFFTAKILQGLSANIHYTSFVPNPEKSDYLIVRDYLRDLGRYFPGEEPSPLGLSFYINAKIIVRVLQEHGESVSQSEMMSILRHGIENIRHLDLGGMLINFNYYDRCAYPLEPHILNLMEKC